MIATKVAFSRFTDLEQFTDIGARCAPERLAHAGVGRLSGPALDAIYLRYREIRRHTDDVGVAQAELRAATARGGN